MTYLTSISKLQIEKVYDFYIIGVLHDIVLGKSPESPPDWVLPGIPFKIQVEKPDWMSFNTPPTVDWLPDEIEMKQGTEETFKFGKAIDFEDNTVRLEFVELKSEGKGYPDWLLVQNATDFAKCIIVVALPEDAPGMTLKLVILISDNHDKKPMTMQYEVQINVPD